MTEDQLLDVDALLGAVDESAVVLKSYEYADIFQRCRDAYDACGDRERGMQMQWELEAWRLVPSHAWEASDKQQPFKPMLVYEDESVWPDLNRFSSEQLDYLAARANGTANPSVRAHYLDIIWARRRTQVDGRGAFDAYLQLFQVGSEPAEDTMLLQHSVTRPLTLALELNDSELLRRACEAINDRLDYVVSRGEFRWTIELAQALLLRANRVNRSDLEHATNCVEMAAEHFARQKNDLLERSALDLTTKLRTKLGLSSKWLRS